jgi:hypothetical protein
VNINKERPLGRKSITNVEKGKLTMKEKQS